MDQKNKFKWIAGVDEAGRGPLAGPVVAAAVILDPKNPIEGLKDSKQLSEAQREALYALIMKKAKAVAIGRADHIEIDQINILRAGLLAMVRAVKALSLQPDYVMVDGRDYPPFDLPGEAVIKGDQTVAAISAASIIAKVTRDREMVTIAKTYPQYKFDQHKGYATELHLTLLAQHGPSPVHRHSFAPVRAALGSELFSEV